MNKLINMLFSSVLLLASCNSMSQNTIQSKKNVQAADEIIKDHISHSEELNSQKALLKALDYLDKAIEFDSLNMLAYQNKVTVLTVLKKHSELIKPLVKLVELKKDFAEGYVTLGLAYENLQKYDSANLAYKNAQTSYLKQKPSDNRNYNLIFIEFLLTKDKNATMRKLKEFDIHDPELKKKLILEIDDWVIGNIN